MMQPWIYVTVAVGDDTVDDVDAAHVYRHGHDPKRRGNSSSTRAPDGIEYMLDINGSYPLLTIASILS